MLACLDVEPRDPHIGGIGAELLPRERVLALWAGGFVVDVAAVEVALPASEGAP
ncbi:MAG: hypothetical protein Q4B12_02135 [Bowdeniella nasicola]|nr:hypothetical protein [Bowdeniella nasicola]